MDGEGGREALPSPPSNEVITRTLTVDPYAPQLSVLHEAISLLWNGRLVAFPTETFYGLGAHAMDADAVERVFAAKGRPLDKPLIVLVESLAMVERLSREISPNARELMARYWPGPLTLVLPAADHLPPAVTGGTGTVSVRVPGHPVALALVRAAGIPITAPSANLSGAAPPTTADEVRAGFGGRIDLILDGGPTTGGLPSTILDVTTEPPRVLRAGAVAVPDLAL